MKLTEILSKTFKLFFDPDWRFIHFADKGRYTDMPDEKYLIKKFHARMGKTLDLKNPKSFNEKLQWLKLYNRNPKYTMLVDKYRVREYIESTLGKEYLIPLLGVWDSAEKIDFASLPERFVLKCNHNSGLGMCICRDKESLDIEKVKLGLTEGLNEDYYKKGREWPYKDVPRRIICEKYMTDSEDETSGLTDYKFFCFDGKADSVMLCLDRESGDTKFYFFDRDWRLCRYNIRGKNAPQDFTLPKPENMDKMFEIASKLSEGLPFARIDLYNCRGQIYFGEITFFPDSGFDPNLLPETDEYFGSLINTEAVKI